MGNKGQRRIRIHAVDAFRLSGGTTVALGSEVGRGSRGIVREGMLDAPSGMKRPVTVKLYPHVPSDERSQVHGALISIASQLHTASHPSLHVPFEVGISDGVPYAVFPTLKSARSLATILRERERISFDAAMLVALAVCDAVAAAHEAGVVHGDLSPRQVLVTERGDVKVTDFAEYRTCQGTSGVQRAIPLWERLAHVAPEIVRGSAPTFATDVFSLGVLLNALFQGPRFTKDLDGDALLAAVRSGEVVRPIFAPLLPAELAEVLHKALSRRPEDRFPSAIELAEALRGVLLAANLPDPRRFVAQALAAPMPAREWESGGDTEIDVHVTVDRA